MANTSSSKPNSTPIKVKNPLETLGEFGTSTAREVVKGTADIGRGVFEQIMGVGQSESNEQEAIRIDQKEQFSPSAIDAARSKLRSHLEVPRPLFNYVEHTENVTNKQEIRELTMYLREELKRSIQVLKNENAQFADEVRDAEKIVMQDMPEAPTLYDLSFVEVLVQLMQTLIQEVRESRTWLGAFTSKKSKRGSLFAKRAKDQGTQYSLSAELQVTRNTQ